MQKINKLYAFIATEPDGGEGIVAFQNPKDGMYMPMVGADRARVESFKDKAQQIGEQLGCDIKLVEFDNRIDHYYVSRVENHKKAHNDKL